MTRWIWNGTFLVALATSAQAGEPPLAVAPGTSAPLPSVAQGYTPVQIPGYSSPILVRSGPAMEGMPLCYVPVTPYAPSSAVPMTGLMSGWWSKTLTTGAPITYATVPISGTCDAGCTRCGPCCNPLFPSHRSSEKHGRLTTSKTSCSSCKSKTKPSLWEKFCDWLCYAPLRHASCCPTPSPYQPPLYTYFRNHGPAMKPYEWTPKPHGAPEGVCGAWGNMKTAVSHSCKTMGDGSTHSGMSDGFWSGVPGFLSKRLGGRPIYMDAVEPAPTPMMVPNMPTKEPLGTPPLPKAEPLPAPKKMVSPNVSRVSQPKSAERLATPDHYDFSRKYAVPATLPPVVKAQPTSRMEPSASPKVVQDANPYRNNGPSPYHQPVRYQPSLR